MLLIQLARLDRPIGIYLLLWPTLFALWLAADGFPGWHLLIVFSLGTALTRSAGCIINDIADRDFDNKVQRTANRPLTTGQISLPEAVIFMLGLLFIALILVLTTNLYTLVLAFLAALVAAAYPLMKRYTYLPQVVLGIAFSFGIPMAFTAVNNEIPNVAWILMIANIIWTVAYDTEYAMVDRDDDLQVGIKSTAILFGDMDKLIIGALQLLYLIIMLLLVRLVELGWTYYMGLAVAAGLFVYQQFLIADRSKPGCFTAFLNNHWVGASCFTGLFLQYFL